MKFFLRIFLFLLIFNIICCYDFISTACLANNLQQSPVNINYNQTIYSDTNYFRILTNDFKPITPEDKWTYFPNEFAIGVQPSQENADFGNLLLVKDWSIYNFILKKILFRYGTEHRIENSIETAEMQLIFILDANYYSPGKRIFLDTNYLIVSIPFRLKTSNDDKEVVTRLFEFMNLKGFASNGNNSATKVGMNRNIKLHQFIVHQPSFLYKGTLSFPECQNALWLIFTQYQFISADDLSNLRTIISAYNSLTVDNPYNTRDIKSLNANTIIYRNFVDINVFRPKPSLLNYNSGSFSKISYLLCFLMIIFLLI